MKIQNPFIIGLATTMFALGMVLPASAELVPQPYSNIIDWEDEFTGNTYAQTSKSEISMQGPERLKNSSCHSQTVVLDWEDEFTCTSYEVTSPNKRQLKQQGKNAASWSFEDWQSM